MLLSGGHDSCSYWLFISESEIEVIIAEDQHSFKKGCLINFLRFFTDRSTVSKKIEMNKNYGTLHWSKDQDLPHFR